MSKQYMLEVQYFHDDKYSYSNTRFTHLGYITKIFKSKKDASNYYNQHNPHMKPLNECESQVSDYDPNTKLRYIIRRYYGEYLSISPF
jgi:hypothetical protein